MEIFKNKYLYTKIENYGSAWVAQQQFWLFGTATYSDGTMISSDEARKDARLFFNALDRHILNRKDYDENRRLQRLAFIETGRTRTNTHIHFFIKGTKWHDYRQIWHLSEQLWADKITKGYNLVMQDNI